MTRQNPPPGPSRPRRRVTPALGLFLLAPLVAEYLLGNIAIDQLAGLLVLAPMYGGGALLIREVTRRAGRGWPTMFLLALAYGLLEAGLLDQSLFNPSYLGYDFQTTAHVPQLGVSAYYALLFLIGHTVWSIAVPIALVESFTPAHRTTPWLGRFGLAVTALVFVAGSGFIFYDHQVTEDFLPERRQLLGTAGLILLLIVVAFLVRRSRQRPATGRPAPDPWLVGGVAFLAGSLFWRIPEDRNGVALGIALVLVLAVVVLRWARRPGWDARHRLALAAGAVLTYCWFSFTIPPMLGSTGRTDLIGNAVFAAAAVLLLLAAGRAVRTGRARRADRPAPAPDRS
ncbi:hypothetical protein O7627_05290 [Solwaraspora sp. WMMD1047]|uniref:hypothetical protein n=1 Tax=Solwaraspora sp. WMMD1047 TaxID=3016102 RepID=UPI00241745AE|nr:hypothetical protein [Solwaraspora sp. WMMD1047]MDG4828721.1 hypothetical protein [Solwaraspora sp. WMMD1047]